MTLNKLRKLTDAFKACGGQAIEVVSGAQTDNQTQSMAGLAQRFEMYASCGSDFHVPGNGWQELGRFSKLPAACKPVWELWH